MFSNNAYHKRKQYWINDASRSLQLADYYRRYPEKKRKDVRDRLRIARASVILNASNRMYDIIHFITSINRDFSEEIPDFQTKDNGTFSSSYIRSSLYLFTV